MDLFWKSCAAILIGLILILTLGKQEKDMSALLSMAVCCMAAVTAMEVLEPVLDYLYSLQSLVLADGSLLTTLLQIVGTGLVAEITAMICTDAGNSSLGKSIQILASAVIWYLSVPIFQSLFDLIRQILGEL